MSDLHYFVSVPIDFYFFTHYNNVHNAHIGQIDYMIY